uniref:30S ribosomal protein S19 n=1 Tax=Rodentolepis nana TaxID=102285 RepID=A0A0R3TUC7_RODNA
LKSKRDALRKGGTEKKAGRPSQHLTGRTEDVQAWRRQSAVLRHALRNTADQTGRT